LLILERIFEHAIPHVRKHGGWRITCMTRYDHANNRTHLRLLGFKVEAMLRFFGTDKSHYLQYVYHLDDEAAEQPDKLAPAAAGEASSLRSPAAA
jgi:hypothetical protein